MFENGFPRAWSTIKKLAWLFRSVINAVIPVLKTVTGNPIHILDALAKPAQALSIALEPIQDLNGYDSPWPAGGGKQLIPYPYKDTLPITRNGITFTDIGNGVVHAQGTAIIAAYLILYGSSSTPIPSWVKPNTTYTLRPLTVSTKYFCQFILYGSQTYAMTGGTFTTPNDLSEYTGFSVVIGVYTGAEVNDDISPMLEIGSTATAWSPYSNICPISGHTDADLIVSPTLNQSDGTTYPIPLGTTVYGGTLDVVNGKVYARPYYPSYNGETLVGPWVSSMDKYEEGATPTTGAQVVDMGGTVTEISLTPEEITLYEGENNLWSDAGDMTLTYYADGNASDVEALNILLGGRYVNNHGEDEPTDREALSIVLGGKK